eukprot:6184770-Pleurochrysis_carterae.AAC.1
MEAAPSIAPPKRGPIVSSPEQSDEIRSLPARAVTIVLCAPEAHSKLDWRVRAWCVCVCVCVGAWCVCASVQSCMRACLQS